MKTLLAILCLIFVTSCTENERARSWGGTANVDIPAGQKLFDVTWKENELWYATRPMREGETPEVYTFQEKSAFGLMEGKVIFTENR